MRFFKMLILFLLVSCSSGKTGSDPDLSSNGQETKFTTFMDYNIYFHGLFDNNLGDCSIDEYGNILIDNGSFSAGRVQFRITDVEISKEERPEEPGCADICPPRVIISFDCKKSGDCITDPAMDSNYKSGALIYSVESGRKAYEFLKDFQQFIENNP